MHVDETRDQPSATGVKDLGIRRSGDRVGCANPGDTVALDDNGPILEYPACASVDDCAGLNDERALFGCCQRHERKGWYERDSEKASLFHDAPCDLIGGLSSRSRSPERLQLAHVHSADEPLLDRVGMLNHHVQHDVSLQIANDLVDLHNRAPSSISREVDGLDSRIECRPLAGPILTHGSVADDAAAFPRVGPIHVRVHGGKHGVDVARIERGIRLDQQFPYLAHARLDATVSQQVVKRRSVWRCYSVLLRYRTETIQKCFAPTLGVETRVRRAAFAVIGLAAAAVAAFLWGRAVWTESDEGAAATQVVRVARRDVGAFVKATGIIKPRVGAEVRVGSRISGVVKRLYVRIGDRVAKGQLLAELDDRDLIARRDEASAALQQAEVNLAYATTDLQRRLRLSSEGVLSRSESDIAERAAAVAEKQVTAARASLAFATAQLAYARIDAPIAGVVASVSTQEGETVAASFAAPTFVTLIDLARLEVWAYVDETDIGRIGLGQQARFTVDTYGDHEFEGRVATVYPKAEIRDNVVNYVTVIRCDPPRDRTLRPEMTTTVRIALDLRQAVLALPIRAVRREGERTFVLARRGEAVERRWVTTGSRDESHWEIVDGLREGDEVLVGDVSMGGARDDRAARDR